MGDLAAMKADQPRGANCHRVSGALKVTVVERSDIPPPAPRSQYEAIFEQMYKLEGAKALRIEFESENQSVGARTSLRKSADKAGCKVYFSRGRDAEFLWFAWVERPENRQRPPEADLGHRGRPGGAAGPKK